MEQDREQLTAVEAAHERLQEASGTMRDELRRAQLVVGGVPGGVCRLGCVGYCPAHQCALAPVSHCGAS